MTIALARRYRPRRFSELLVQDHVAAALRGAVARNRVGHGYLLTGPRGVGKTTAARILAMALNCENRGADGEPCGACTSCQRIWTGSANLDVVEIDAASNRGVDDARDLRERAMYAASQEGHHKVYIIDEAHMLTREAWNALLKILEEPPPGVVFVFATTEPQKIANTAAPVMSRLQRFDFRRIGPAAIEARLRAVLAAEQLEAEDDALRLIARHADGGMRDALSVLDQCLSFGEGALTAQRVREVLGLMGEEAFADILAAVTARRPGDLFPALDRLTDAGADLVEFAGGLGEVLRAVVMRHYGTEPEGLTESARAMIATAAAQLAPEDAVRMLKLLGDAEPALRRSSSPRLVLETLLLRWAMMDRAVELRTLLEGGALARPVAGAVSAPSAPPAAMPIPRRAKQEQPGPRDPGPGAADASSPAIVTDIVQGWSAIVAAANRQSRLLGQALDQAVPSVGADGAVVLSFGPDSAVFREGVQRQLATVEAIVAASLGGSVAIRLTETGRDAGAPKPARLTVDQVREERLAELKRTDPALKAAADSLDLELVDDS
jgi:DNA polymerase-3 subunit gamma/tau